MTRLVASFRTTFERTGLKNPYLEPASRSHAAAVASLVAVTREAKRALALHDAVPIRNFPFKVGRESRSPEWGFAPPLIDRRLGETPQLNDVYLLEPPWSDLSYISREHFLIERVGDQFFVVDRKSVCGTVVGETQIGGNRTGGRVEIRSGDLIVVGSVSSNYIFRFEVNAGLDLISSIE